MTDSFNGEQISEITPPKNQLYTNKLIVVFWSNRKPFLPTTELLFVYIWVDSLHFTRATEAVAGIDIDLLELEDTTKGPVPGVLRKVSNDLSNQKNNNSFDLGIVRFISKFMHQISVLWLG